MNLLRKLRIAICPSRKKRKQLRTALQNEQYKKNNTIDIPSDVAKYVRLTINGKNNKVRIGNIRFGGAKTLNIVINGSDNEITIENGVYIRTLGITIGEPGNSPKAHDTSVHIGERSTFAQTCLMTIHSHTRIEIGRDCMFSSGIYIQHTDSHPIYELGQEAHFNYADELKIGNHVWVGMGVNILKNVKIADDCILGAYSVIAKSFSEEHCAIAGNPARIIRRGITWRAQHTEEFIENKRP